MARGGGGAVQVHGRVDVIQTCRKSPKSCATRHGAMAQQSAEIGVTSCHSIAPLSPLLRSSEERHLHVATCSPLLNAPSVITREGLICSYTRIIQ